jgi:hypothetical protein
VDLYSIITLVFLLLILVPFVLAVIFRISQNRAAVKAYEQRAALEERLRRAIPAAATIVSARVMETNPAGERLRARLTLRVEPPGAEAFTAVADWLVDPVMQTHLQPGSPLSVKVDADDRNRVYPNIDWAQPAP